ncbi:putative serine protease K12H4.7-like isoform X2, partial [Dinothrombium tinctorium]
MRLKYPEQVIGAVSSSAPVQAELNFKQFFDEITKTIGSDCASNIRKATEQLYSLIDDKNQWIEIKNKLQLCENFDGNNKKDVSHLFFILAIPFHFLVATSANQNDIQIAPYAKYNMKTVCEMMANESLGTEFDRYAAVNELRLEVFNKTCTNFTHEYWTKLLQEIDYDKVESLFSGERQRAYQRCNEFGSFKSSDSQNHPFGHSFPIKFFLDTCLEIFGKNFDAESVEKKVKFTNELYGGNKINVTNVIFTQGSLDPDHELGVTNYTYSNSTAILIDGASLCSDTYSDSINDSPQLKAAREEISNFLGNLLK